MTSTTDGNSPRTYRITLPCACFGVRVQDGRVSAQGTAPIAMWAAGKPWAQVRMHYLSKHAPVERLLPLS